MEGGGGDPGHGAADASSAAEPRNVNEEVVRRYCEQYNDEMKGQAGRDLLFDFKDMHNELAHFGTHSNADGTILGITAANDLQLGRGITALTCIQGTLLGAHLEGTAQEAKLSALTEGDKFEALMEHLAQRPPLGFRMMT